MANARKLPSGSWRCLVFSHYETVIGKDGKTGRKRIYRSFTNSDPSAHGRRKCEATAAAWAAEKKSHATAASLTVGDAMTAYIESKKGVLSPATYRSYDSIRRNDMDDIQGKKIDSLTSRDIQWWISNLTCGHSVKTVKNAYALFTATLEMFAPGMHFKPKFAQSPARKYNVPSMDDVTEMLKHSSGNLHRAIVIGAYGGLRRGEICALTTNDLHKGYIVVNKSRGLDLDGNWNDKTPKTVSSNRVVPFPEDMLDELTAANTEDSRIITCTPNNITVTFGKLMKRLDMPYTFHSLRHFWASALHGIIKVPDQYVMEMGGWSSDQTLKRVYRGTLRTESETYADKTRALFTSMQHAIQHDPE